MVKVNLKWINLLSLFSSFFFKFMLLKFNMFSYKSIYFLNIFSKVTLFYSNSYHSVAKIKEFFLMYDHCSISQLINWLYEYFEKWLLRASISYHINNILGNEPKNQYISTILKMSQSSSTCKFLSTKIKFQQNFK